MPKPKAEAWKWCSKYIRLRDSIDYCRRAGLPLDTGIVQCCTCSAIKQWKYVDAGHFISRGSGGASGVYFDERNIAAQCKICNAFYQGRTQEYRDYILNKYGQEVIDELNLKNKTNSYKGQFLAIGLIYKQMYEGLLAAI